MVVLIWDSIYKYVYTFFVEAFVVNAMGHLAYVCSMFTLQGFKAGCSLYLEW